MLSWLYGSALKLRNYSYDKQILRSIKVAKPVVSIGNITVGGTGKTPVVDDILYWARQSGIKAGVVSRGDGGNYKGIVKVTSILKPEIFGDEPTMLSMRNKDIPIYLSPDRVAAASELIRNENIDIIIADDAFQHRRLNRNLDIVIIDLLETKENYNVLPFGRAREEISGISRADIVILNKANLVTEQQVVTIKNMLLPYCQKKCEFILGEYKAGKLISMKGELKKNGASFLLVSGIGRPRSFESLVRSKNINVVHHEIFKDHYKYSEQDMKKIIILAQEKGVQDIICTQKDAVKLNQLINSTTNLNWFYLDMHVELIGVHKLYDKINCLCS